jgi:hypothetical protein
MNRRVLAPAATLVFCVFAGSAVFGQAKPAAPTTPAPATPAKFVKPIKGIAYIEVIQGQSKRVGNEVVTVVKVKNVSPGAIHLLKLDEYWYDKSRKKIVSGSTESWRKPINPGDIIEFTMKSPWNAAVDTSQYMFSHVNGEVKAKAVKKFE